VFFETDNVHLRITACVPGICTIYCTYGLNAQWNLRTFSTSLKCCPPPLFSACPLVCLLYLVDEFILPEDQREGRWKHLKMGSSTGKSIQNTIMEMKYQICILLNKVLRIHMTVTRD